MSTGSAREDPEMRGLRCVQLRKSFGGVRALDNVGLEFPTTGSIGIIGPNGAGKTTLLNVLTGFLRPDSGHCFIGGRETTGLLPHRMAQLGISRTFQEVRLAMRLSVLENVLLGFPRQRGEQVIGALFRLGVQGEERRNYEAALNFLEFVELDGKVLELAGEISYGQQKLLTLACCMATGAQILLLDEPVAGVHAELRKRIVRMLRQVRDQGKLIVFVEHDIAAVRDMADRVVVMDEGKVIDQGPTREVLERPAIIEAYLG